MEIYRYCSVRVDGVEQLYSYISDFGTLPPGTRVLVPFGADNAEREGVVMACAAYSAANAPYPVARTKHLLSVLGPGDGIERTLREDALTEEEQRALCEVWDLIDREDWDGVYDWTDDWYWSENAEILREVARCLSLCADEGMSAASLNLGAMYYTGRGVEQNYQKAFELYKTAADAGERRALCNCGYCFYYGRHQEPDYAEALRYFNLGVALYGDANCLYKIGDMHKNGLGVPKNELFAYLIYRHALDAAESPYDDGEDAYSMPDIQLRIGECLLRGIGAEKNVTLAHELLCSALNGFYARRKEDPFAGVGIKRSKELIAEAQSVLDAEI